MKRPSRKRLVILASVGIAVLALGAAVVHHPYFYLVVWQKQALDEHVREHNSDFLSRAYRSPVLPHSMRQDCFLSWIESMSWTNHSMRLPDERVEELRSEFPDLDPFIFDMVYKPYPDGTINPTIRRLILDSTVDYKRRWSLFSHLFDTYTLTDSQVREVYDLWEQIEHEKLKQMCMNLIANRTRNHTISSNVTEKFKPVFRPTNGSTVPTGARERAPAVP